MSKKSMGDGDHRSGRRQSKSFKREAQRSEKQDWAERGVQPGAGQQSYGQPGAGQQAHSQPGAGQPQVGPSQQLPPDHQPAHKRNVRGRTATVFFGMLLTIVVIAVLVAIFVARSREEFKGDLVAFCELLEEAEFDSAPDYDALVEVAPKAILLSVAKLQNTSKEISELEQSDDIAAYFAASFDLEAHQARRDLDAYAFTECDLEIPEANLRQDINNYINQRFGDSTWVGSAQLDLTLMDGLLYGLTVELEDVGNGIQDSQNQPEPNTAIALEACQAYDEYLRSRLVPGPLVVRHRQAGSLVSISAPDRNTGCAQ